MTIGKNILLLGLLLSSSAAAQQVPRQAIEDSVLGWMTVYHYTGVRPPLVVDAKHYSRAQLAIADSFVNWIQASYQPKGGLGDVLRTVSPKLGLYNQNDAALPQTYGAYAKTYFELKYSPARKLVPFTNSHLYWSIRANAMFGEPLLVLNTPTDYYFLIPGYGNPAVAERAETKRYDSSQHPAVKRYITWFNDARKSINVNATFVLLSHDNKPPFLAITKGEYLDKLAGAVDRKFAAEQAAAINGWPEGNARTAALKDADTRYQKRLTLLRTNRERYDGRLQDPAAVPSLQPDELLENYQDVFEGSGGPGARYPVYKIDPRMAALAAADSPQWILITWDGDLLDPVGKQMHEAILNNFNFDYVYNFFFDPAKVKGQPYRPLRSPDSKEAVVVSEASDAARKNAADPGVHFFEDFSTTALGKRPTAWAVGRSAGTIATLEGLPGNWAVMAGDAMLTPKQLRTPLPRDFTLSYDLVAAQNFTWGAKGLTLRLARETSPGTAESYLELKLRPGFDGRDGEAALETRFPSGYLTASKWLVAAGFSNNKQNNRITVSIRKSGETMQLFLDQNKIAEFDKAIPAGLLFNKLSFVVLGNASDEHDKFYVSQVRISSP